MLPISVNDQILTYYSVQQEQLTSDSGFLGKPKNFEYYNLVHRSNFPYYKNDKMLAGILIDIHPDIIETTRNVYGISEWLGEIGGFSSSVLAIISLIIPLVQTSSLQKYLVSKLFKQQQLD